MKDYLNKTFFKFSVLMMPLLSTTAQADVPGMMRNLQNTILDILAPLICVCGIVFSGFKLAMGDESGG